MASLQILGPNVSDNARVALLDMCDQMSVHLYGKRFERCLGRPQTVVCGPETSIEVNLTLMRTLLKSVRRSDTDDFTPVSWMKAMCEHAQEEGIEVATY